MTIKNHQTTEEAWFANTGLSKDLLDFLNIMGKKIKLKGYQGYAAGLDTKCKFFFVLISSICAHYKKLGLLMQ